MSGRYFIFALIFLLSSWPAVQSRPQEENWQSFRSERFGYSLLFPADMLRLVSESPDGKSLEFLSEDGQTKLRVLTTLNSDNVSPSEYRAEIIEKLSDYRSIKYGPRGNNWFVLSGIRGDSIFYQKVMFSCRGRVINAFAMTYPSLEKREYDPIVTTIEKNFRASSGAGCGANR
jgi:hypothetical protein